MLHKGTDNQNVTINFQYFGHFVNISNSFYWTFCCLEYRQLGIFFIKIHIHIYESYMDQDLGEDIFSRGLSL